MKPSDVKSPKKIISFTQLNAYKASHQLALDVYGATKLFPDDEKFALVNQLRRAAISAPSNIAEGFSRSSEKERLHFYTIALGSITEIQSQLLISKDLQYLPVHAFNQLASQTVDASKLLKGLMRSIKLQTKT
jgi:four helix bundle protein